MGCKQVLVLPIPSTVVIWHMSAAQTGIRQAFTAKCLEIERRIDIEVRCTIMSD
jgi:hypothetical protein